MGQKASPILLRIPQLRNWKSKWFYDKTKGPLFIKQDYLIRKHIQKTTKDCGIAEVEIIRDRNMIEIVIYTSRPGVMIGKKGQRMDTLRKELQKIIGKDYQIKITVKEVLKPYLCARIIMQEIINDLEKRIPYRRTMKSAIEKAKNSQALGIKVQLAGRLNGVEIARTETMIWGRMPLHTFRSDIDYSRGTAFTIYGCIGVKVWIYRGDVFSDKDKIKLFKEE